MCRLWHLTPFMVKASATTLAERGTWEKVAHRDLERWATSSTASSNFQGGLQELVAQHITHFELPSTNNLKRLRREASRNPILWVSNSSSVMEQKPNGPGKEIKWEEQSLITPPIPAWPGLLHCATIKVYLKDPGGGGDQAEISRVEAIQKRQYLSNLSRWNTLRHCVNPSSCPVRKRQTDPYTVSGGWGDFTSEELLLQCIQLITHHMKI